MCALLINPLFMEKHINITDIDAINGPEVIQVQYDTIIPEFYLRHVIDLASIVGNHHVAREAYISEYEPEYMPAFV